MDKFNEDLMKEIAAKAEKSSRNGIGGPFGAAVVKDGKAVCITVNTVLAHRDPTAHAEVNAIREACKILGTHDLSGCELYATSEPCPMCLSAAIWANIKTVYYGCRATDAEEIGFRDDKIYNFIGNGCSDKDVLDLQNKGRDVCIQLFENYAKLNGTLY